MCVAFLRENLGVNIRGDSWTLRPNAKLSEVGIGDVVLIKFGPAKDDIHAVMISGYTLDGKQMLLAGSNYPDRCTPSVIAFNFDDQRILGYIRT